MADTAELEAWIARCWDTRPPFSLEFFKELHAEAQAETWRRAEQEAREAAAKERSMPTYHVEPRPRQPVVTPRAVGKALSVIRREIERDYQTKLAALEARLALLETAVDAEGKIRQLADQAKAEIQRFERRFLAATEPDRAVRWEQ